MNRVSLASFLGVSLLLFWAWGECRGTLVERAVIDVATVRTSVAVINFLTPDVQAVAAGPRVLASGGGINVRSGCEGTEVAIPLVAALVAFPFTRRMRVIGVAAALVWVFLLNQARLLILFYSFRHDSTWFGYLHGLITPLVLVVSTVVFFGLLLQWNRIR
jgi:exosortase/archaeosortase family protein